MPLSAGDKLGPYEIISSIGKGGMGEVYRAHDPRTGRDVAIKVSAERFNERFDREVRAVAALNHPNICTLFDVGPNYLVMELVEGESPLGPMPFDEALRIARQIAAALEQAHEKNIVHRDLKPANIKIKPDGTVKVLDFGLAKVPEPEGRATEDSPTLSMAATKAGVILGTAAYMSPEQARGKPIDKRADIWAFGVVLHELLTGERLFQGDDLTETLASVVKERPDFSRVPTKVRPLLEKCLEKDPKKRLRDIGDMDLLLDAPHTLVSATTARGFRRWLWPVIAALLFAVAGLVGFIHFREAPPGQRVVRFQIQPIESAILAFFNLSPDGRAAVFPGNGKLLIRTLDALEPQSLPGTDNEGGPFWSPDSQYIGFTSQGKLKKIAAAGGPSQVLCDVPTFVGATWNRDGDILFGQVPLGLFRVSEAGGSPTQVTRVGEGGLHVSPFFLPDGRHFLYTVAGGKPEKTGIYIGSLDGHTDIRLLADATNARYVPARPGGSTSGATTGYLVFPRGGALIAQPFDPERLALTGAGFPIAEKVAGYGGFGFFSTSDDGTLAYVSGSSSATTQLVWRDRMGKSAAVFAPPATYNNFRLSPDEKRVVFDSDQAGNQDVWIFDSVRGVTSRITFDPAADNLPMWSPDGLRIVWPSLRGGKGFDLYVKSANGTGKEDLLVPMGTPNGWASDWSRDGRNLLYQRPGEKTGQDLWIAPQSSGAAKEQEKPYPYLQGQFDETEGKFSPDGRWVAYVSNESGRPEVYVQSFPISGARFQISSGGGTQAQWRKDGHELFYVAADQTLMAMPVKLGQTFEPGPLKPLFSVPLVLGFGVGRSYAASGDGQRFLVTSAGGGLDSPPITMVLNWQSGLKK